MNKDFGQGIFTMDVITKTAGLKDLGLAKNYVKVAIALSSENATESNRRKAFALVENAKTINRLVLDMSNFSLAHQGLKTI